MIRCFALCLAFFFSVAAYSRDQTKDTLYSTLKSPDNNISFSIYEKTSGQFFYTITYKGAPVILESQLDIQLDNHLSEQAMALPVDRHADWCENLSFLHAKDTAVYTTWNPVYGEREQITDHYNGRTFSFVKDDAPIYKMNIEVRAYNEGVAFRYFFPENERGTYYRVVDERTTFQLPNQSKVWFTGWAQGLYSLLPLQNWPQEAERPLTAELPNGLWLSLCEAGMVDYSRTKFKLHSTQPNTIQTSMYTPVDLISPAGSPWRTILIAEKPGDLITANDLLLNLNLPSKIEDVSWIRPGKIMRVMKQTTSEAKATIDFAAAHHMQYILFDWKWYGPAFTFSSDATKTAIPDFDLPEIIRYGREKGIGVWLYANMQALVAQSDSLFKVYEQWGIKGVKFGFVQVGSHRWTTWLEEMFKKAAANKIMVNVHDDWRPTGEQRTWPNLLTAEGIRGNEEMPDAGHNTILPFTRGIAGAADYTFCYFDKRIKTSFGHQLALPVVIYSPLQTMFWYDTTTAIKNIKAPELDFWTKLPTSWNDTKILQGRPGDFITVARRHENDWFVGTINNTIERDVSLSLDFLPAGKQYMATLYSDDETTRVHIEEKRVNAKTKLSIKLKGSGGAAIYLTPVPERK